MIDTTIREARFAMVTLAKNRGATLLCVLSVALGIGITTALFSAVEAIVFRAAPFAHPQQLCTVASQDENGHGIGYGWPDVVAMAKAAAGSAELLAYQTRVAFLSQGEASESTCTAAVTTNFFSLLGVRAEIGEATVDMSVDGRPQAVLSHRLWRRRFGSDSGIVGRTVLLNKKAFRIAGVMPTAFSAQPKGFFSDVLIGADAWFDVIGERHEREEANGPFQIIARLEQGANPVALGTRLDLVIRGPSAHKPAPRGAQGTWLDANYAPTWSERLKATGVLLPVFGLLLLVACGNVAQVRLAQAEARKRELGVRAALGSGSWALARLLLTEAALVIGAGAAIGVLLARALIQWMVNVFAVQFGADFDAQLDWRVLGFSLAATTASLLLAGLVPARHALRLDINEVLKSGRETARTKSPKLLIAGQAASSVAFFGMAVLFLQSFHNAAGKWPGFIADKPMIVFSEADLKMEPTLWAEQACQRLEGVPGVRGTSFCRRLPLSHTEGGWDAAVEAAGHTPVIATQNAVGPNYFSLMGTRLLAGRAIGPGDRAESPLVAVVSQELARRLFGDKSPLGERVKIEDKPREVVGVCADEPVYDLHEEHRPSFYLPYSQRPVGLLTLVVETAGRPELLIPVVQKELKRFDAGAVMFDLTTLSEHMQRALFEDRIIAGATLAVGILGFLLTAAGLFGVIQYAVNRRTREIGVCLALGAGPSRVQGMILGQSLRMIVWGVVAGLGLVSLGGWAVRSFVLGVTSLNPLPYVSSATVALVVALAAAWLPAHRAAGVDPAEALRSE